tara:strand:+ start:492 stop:635 length:144 start_codon:yes stop_codon:yes gene_type:complete
MSKEKFIIEKEGVSRLLTLIGCQKAFIQREVDKLQQLEDEIVYQSKK